MSRIRGGATRIIQGIQHFQEHIFGGKKSLFRRLGEGQKPLALFITCSDSRIDPSLLTQTQPGEIFILRNAGNLIPPHGVHGGEAATLEYALKQLYVPDVIVCGHSQCGAMQGLLAPEALQSLPEVAAWLEHARAIIPAVEQAAATLSPAEKLNLAIEQNVLLQLEHLKTYPFVAEALSAGRLHLHGWVYFLESGQVKAHVPGHARFMHLEEAVRKQLSAASSDSTAHGVLGDSI
ncbi:MAG: carbonic anhydrase [Gemmataceae bacterium]